MHPHLSNPRNLEACRDIADELGKCRDSGFFAKYLGGCNDVKQKLIMCLRKERIERTSQHIEESRQKKKTPEEAWKRHVAQEKYEQRT
ncbi:uncharacterized protein EI90DRAFT_261627 [Cantharellus anzutake]|uniref:uncharacterized protein n=1 Tax=Cantharellus anzutake TaxID=1750568 RepID=UPI001904C58E|nr:uncharacterized protein EI90DRAFT_261627 [Cantharellus anzutake]KAF8335826.1 hypothetical protein EI90DRAFT_261627 [Cantharellus anzutake]